MNAVIHKHVFNTRETHQGFAMVKGAEILSVQNQRGVLTLWEAHDPAERDTELRMFQLWMTGVEMPTAGCRFVGTVQMDDTFVVHVFEKHRPQKHQPQKLNP